MNTSIPTPKQHALVLGGSLSGLVTAKVLSRYFAKVTIVEKDTVQRTPEARKGQPQVRHIHGLLPGGLQLLSGYFPGLLNEMTSYGVSVLDFAGSMNWYCYGGFRKAFRIGIDGILITRPLLEHIIRERVLAIPHVQLLDNTAAKQFITTNDKQRLTGVTVEDKTTGNLVPLYADLIIDATGRGSRTPHLLEELGYEAVPMSEVKVNVAYTTRMYNRAPDDPLGSSWVLSTPKHLPKSALELLFL
jgi:2-polyprenyl-6-methoxyphenol hydroxylase-like FAD-dependent oxidoreductase